MRKWCDDTGLPGARIAQGHLTENRRERGGADAEGQVITGHRKSKTFVYYRAKANRSSLPDHAMSNLPFQFDAGSKRLETPIPYKGNGDPNGRGNQAQKPSKICGFPRPHLVQLYQPAVPKRTLFGSISAFWVRCKGAVLTGSEDIPVRPLSASK